MAMLYQGKSLRSRTENSTLQNPVVAQFLTEAEARFWKAASMQLQRNEIMTGLLVIGTIAVVVSFWFARRRGVIRPLVTTDLFR
jgi:hypothetical protein